MKRTKNIIDKDSERLIVDDENMRHIDLFKDIFPMVCIAVGMFGAVAYFVIGLIGLFL